MEAIDERSEPPAMRWGADFEPDRPALLELRMWKAYYRRQPARLFGTLVRNWPLIEPSVLGPPGWPQHPLALAIFGMRALRSAQGVAKSMFAEEPARALFAGIAAHGMLPLDRVSFDPHFKGVFDEKGRMTMAAWFNNDTGDSWEWADDPSYPEKFSALGIRIMLNYVVYSMTH